jgi:hypothetical protein
VTPDELRAVGEALYGKYWQTPMAEALPCETRTIRHWLSGKRKIRPMVEARIRSLAIGKDIGQI